MIPRRCPAILCAVLALVSCRPEAPESAALPVAGVLVQIDGMDGAEAFAAICAVCHGATGEGNPVLRAPSIASLPDWYVLDQFTKFQGDMRGNNPEDIAGAQMHLIANALGDTDLEPVAIFVSELPRIPTENTLGGHPQGGRESYQIHCEECHRPSATGDMVFKSPPLIGLQDWYLKAQLEKFRDRVRGGHPDDLEGFKMQAASEKFLSPQDELDVLAYIAELAQRKPRRW